MPTLIQNQQPRRVSQRLLRRAVEETLQKEGIRPRGVEVSIALVDDMTIQALNARYRQKDTPTDVLSFTQDAPTLPGSKRLLGDIVVSVETATRQAVTGGRTLNDEVAQLVIHGMLHLLGYDDATTEGFSTMVRAGAQIWTRVQCHPSTTPSSE